MRKVTRRKRNKTMRRKIIMKRKTPNEEVQEEDSDVSSLSTVSCPWLGFGGRFLGTGPLPSMPYPL